jgi:hypothetical protein
MLRYSILIFIQSHPFGFLNHNSRVIVKNSREEDRILVFTFIFCDLCLRLLLFRRRVYTKTYPRVYLKDAKMYRGLHVNTDLNFETKIILLFLPKISIIQTRSTTNLNGISFYFVYLCAGILGRRRQFFNHSILNLLFNNRDLLSC